eukprot:scaffold19288_cov142-Isochrysis_galbana.AAC.5
MIRHDLALPPSMPAGGEAPMTAGGEAPMTAGGMSSMPAGGLSANACWSPSPQRGSSAHWYNGTGS